MSSRSLIGLDVGEKRIGVAMADTTVRIAIPLKTIEVDGNEVEAIRRIIEEEHVDVIVVGYPRNQKGEPTAQTAFVEAFANRLGPLGLEMSFQDESLTSVIAEQRLVAHGKPYAKGDIDAQAAAIILQDYVERYYG